MSTNLGPGVSRVLSSDGTEYTDVIFQKAKPPLDAEFNLLQELSLNACRRVVLREMPSGWLGDDTNPSTIYSTNGTWSNWFQFGRQRAGEQKAVLWAAVNGWMLPITGTRTGTPPGSPDDTSTWNKIALDPPPANAGDFRIDYVFLEVWQARIPPNPSVLNKPSISAIYRYGNVEGGASFLPDDLQDPALGFETTQRVQLQYRLRVVKGLVGLTTYPDGFDPVTVKGQGAATAPTSFTFTNMRQTLGDPGLWRAGDGTTNTLGTVDGYVYAIPVAAIFRRNSVVWTGDPSQNLNGGFNRNPTATDRTGITTFSTVATLAVDLSATALTASLVSASNLALPLTPLTPVTIQIGDELLTYQSITTGGAMTLVARGTNGSRAEVHKAGATVTVLAGRPDGLFADQIALTDILDLRHVVSPNGFDYQALLSENLDRLLRGQLRSNWKRSGAGPQGPFVLYQDKITNGSAATGVTKVDGPDNIRTIFSDAAVLQPIIVIVKPTAAAAPTPVGESWSLALQVNQTAKPTPGSLFQTGDALTLPVAQLKSGIPGSDTDQVQWAYDSTASLISIQIDGQTQPVDPSTYVVTPSSPGPSDDLVITLGATFPTTSQRLYITVHALYGAGRGLSRRPDSLHSVAASFPSGDLLLNQQQVATNAFAMRVAPIETWSKFNQNVPGDPGPLSVTAEAYAELGSKTVVLQPLRRIDLPNKVTTLDGSSANIPSTPAYLSGTGSTAASQLVDITTNFTVAGVVVGDAVVIDGVQPGRFAVTSVTTTTNPNDTLNLDRTIATNVTANYALFHGQGLMPLLKRDGTTPKWTTTDPLSLFSGTTEAAAATKNVYISLARSMIPGAGEYDLPLLWADQTPFSQGLNYLLNVPSGLGPFANTTKNYVPFSNGAFTYSAFSTLDLTPPGTNPAVYNAKFTSGGKDYAGIRKFSDPAGLGRQGLQMPPFYGIARVWAIYEANDYKINGSAFGATDRAPTGSGSAAKNLLRQNVQEPLFWIENDDDGDATFIINAAAIDISKSPNPIANFAAGNYIVEASIYGFDRDSFDIQQEFRLVLSRQRTEAISGTRATNISAAIDSPELIVPSPMAISDEILTTFSRTPYQGDAWGSQAAYQDIGYAAGPLQSGDVVALTATQLDQTSLTRPNPKVLEILAEMSFTTTLGTGRLAPATYTLSPNPADVAWEDKSSGWPPTSPVAPRPPLRLEALFDSPLDPIGTSYQGCTERLPLGALYRDKDFRGNSFQPGFVSGILFHKDTYRNYATSAPVSSLLEQSEIRLGTSEVAGRTGDQIVHLDGNQGNWSLITNYRVNRGGSFFSAAGPTPGGEVAAIHPKTLLAPLGANDTRVTVLVGRAYLVRNAVTNIGSSEVSAGNELMLAVQTTAYALQGSAIDQDPWSTIISSNGYYEGNSAADLYHIEGKPLVSDYRKLNLDPTTIPLTRRTRTFIP